MYSQVIFHLPVIARIKASLHHMVESKLEDIRVIWEFLDVFSDDLPGIPLERAIEFKIKLQPGTAPIAKASYKMSPVWVARIKDSTIGLARQGFHSPKFITFWLSGIVHIKERWRYSSTCGLSTIECSHHQEQVSSSMYPYLVWSVSESPGVLQDWSLLWLSPD
jgi:hypothetical protein